MNNNNLALAVILSLGILLSFQYFVVRPQQEYARTHAVPTAPVNVAGTTPVVPTQVLQDRAQTVAASSRVAINGPELSGSINLKGARFDDLALPHYHETNDDNSPSIILLSPSGSAQPHTAYYAEFNWLAEQSSVTMPDADTVWTADSKELTPAHPVKLTWKNPQGLTFERSVAIDEHAMFTVSDRITNAGGSPVTLYPFGIVARQGLPATTGRSVVHEGALGVLDGTLQEYKYQKLIDHGKQTDDSVGGWLGITDKYWLVAMIPPQDEKLTADFTYNRGSATDPNMGFFQSDYRGAAVTVAAGGSAEQVTHLFAGAKRIKLIDAYADQYHIPRFDRAIDFGWFYFLTKPFLYTLAMLVGVTGSIGVAILLFTVLLKLVTLPLTLKIAHSQARMKALGPEIARIHERYPEDKMRQSQETMELYKREKVNPMAGCVPTLIQIPIFFALYKVLYVNIEMRHAPFFGWIRDMSAPDPTSVLNLFGALPINILPSVHIGAWPILMGISMFMQQKLSPQPPDKSQARIFMIMPIIFTYMLASMPAGLVIYWTWSNLLGIVQQWFIMSRDAARKVGA